MNECWLIKPLITAGSTGSAWCSCKPPRATPRTRRPSDGSRESRREGLEIKMLLESLIISAQFVILGTVLGMVLCAGKEFWLWFPVCLVPRAAEGLCPRGRSRSSGAFPAINTSPGCACPHTGSLPSGHPAFDGHGSGARWIPQALQTEPAFLCLLCRL